MTKAPEHLFSYSEFKEAVCKEDGEISGEGNANNLCTGGFVFLDQASRMPLQHPISARSRRSVITLKKHVVEKDGSRSGLPLQLPFVNEKLEASETSDSVDCDADESPRLPFRNMIQSTDLYHPCIKRHYNETNQNEALEAYLASGKEKIKSLKDHMDPTEREHLPLWAGVPSPPLLPKPPSLSPGSSDKERRGKGSNSPKSNKLSPGSPFSESKSAANGRNSLRGSVTKPGLKHRVNPRARAA